MSRWLTALLLMLAPVAALAEGWAALRVPGTAALMRHALAPGVGDPAGFRLDDCATQRNLSDAGRAQARASGAAIRAAGAAPDAVLSSRWCRSAETAALLGLGAVAPAPAFDSFFRDGAARGARTEAARALLAERLGRGERLLVVTHQVNVSALAGGGIGSGETVLVRLGAGGALEVVGRIPAAE